MQFKLRGTNVLGVEIIANSQNYDLSMLKKFIKEKAGVFKGARLIVTVDGFVPPRDELRELSEFVSSLPELMFCGFKTNLRAVKDMCLSLGIPCDIDSLELEKIKERAETEETKFVKKTIRSGEKITSSGDLAILGDVNPGAEIEAGGNVYVFGSLRGTVRAGIGKRSGEVRALFVSTSWIEVCGVTKTFEKDEKYVNFAIMCRDGKLKFKFTKLADL